MTETAPSGGGAGSSSAGSSGRAAAGDDRVGTLKTLAHGLATIVVLPSLVSFHLRAVLIGRDRALVGSSQALGLIPGMMGQYLRRAFLAQVLEECHPTAVIEFGVLFSQTGARIGPHAYVGPRCHLGRAHIGRDVLLAAGVHIPSGPQTHGIDALDIPIRLQPGNLQTVSIGAGAWIGSAAVIMADVGADTVIAAGAVVVQPIPARVIAGGVPARVLKTREEASRDSAERAAAGPSA